MCPLIYSYEVYKNAKNMKKVVLEITQNVVYEH